jgi:hypothetical protein
MGAPFPFFVVIVSEGFEVTNGMGVAWVPGFA